MSRTQSVAVAGAARGRLRPGSLRSAVTGPPVVLGAIVLVAAGLGAAFALRITSFEPDELGYTRLALGIAHSVTPLTLSYGGGQRLNQLYPLLIAPLWGFFGNVTAFRLTHVWNALLLSSAAIPTYLLTREVVRERWAGYLAAALVAALPWLSISTGELTEVAAYPASVWAALAMHRALSEPSDRRDVIALAAIALATFGRLQLAVLAPAFVLALIVHEFGYALTEPGSRPANLRRAVGSMVRGHRLLAGAAAIGIVIGVPLLVTGRLASAAGFYGAGLRGVSLGGATFDLARSYFTGIALGVGAIPAALAIGLVLVSLVSPVSRRVHAYASLLGVVVLVLLLQVAEVSVRFTGSFVQERYLFYIAPLLVVGMFAALLRTRRPAWAALVGCLFLAVAVATTTYAIGPTSFWYQVSPGLTSFYGWVLQAFGGGPAQGAAALKPAGVVIALAGVLMAVVLARVRPARVLVVLTVAGVVFCGAETTHALVDVVNGTPGGAGLGGGSLRDRSWVDSHVPAGARVNQLTDDVGGLAIASQTWNNNAFWNRSVAQSDYVQFAPLTAYLPIGRLRVNQATGALRVPGGAPSAHSPVYLVVSDRGLPIAPVGTVVARHADDHLELVRLATPARTSYLVSGVSPGGWLPVNQPATLMLYGRNPATGQCATVTLTVGLAAGVPSPESLILTSRSHRRSVSLRPGQTTTLIEHVCATPAGPPSMSIAAHEAVSAAGLYVTPQLVGLEVSAG